MASEPASKAKLRLADMAALLQQNVRGQRLYTRQDIITVSDNSSEQRLYVTQLYSTGSGRAS